MKACFQELIFPSQLKNKKCMSNPLLSKGIWHRIGDMFFLISVTLVLICRQFIKLLLFKSTFTRITFLFEAKWVDDFKNLPLTLSNLSNHYDSISQLLRKLLLFSFLNFIVYVNCSILMNQCD